MKHLYREEVRKLRSIGFDVFVVPSDGEVTGAAWATNQGKPGQKRHINVLGSLDSSIWLFVLYHEVAHHHLGHTTRWTSTPSWIVELSADELALDMIRNVEPDAVPACERSMREHVRPMLQDMIDAEVWHHVCLETADRLGCNVPADMRVILERSA